MKRDKQLTIKKIAQLKSDGDQCSRHAHVHTLHQPQLLALSQHQSYSLRAGG